MVKNNVKTYLKINSFGEQQQLIDLLFYQVFYYAFILHKRIIKVKK
nr:MAG TPA: hypothetical protein [Caudoviricetes sp.]DAS22933.1 MAG TPA: hypothetical protein [Bacteriophage sp.]